MPLPFWRRRHSPTVDAVPTHRFRVRLVDPDQRDRAVDVLASRLSSELSCEASIEADGQVRLDLTSTFSPRQAAVLRPLHALDHVKVRVDGFEALDLVTETDDRELAATIDDWERHGHRHRLEALAGLPALERCLARARDASAEGRSRASSWRYATASITFNTAGAEALVLAEAVATDGWHEASSYIDAAVRRAELSRLTGTEPALPEESLVRLVGRRDYAGERAAALASFVAPPLPASLAAALRAAVATGGELGAAASAALGDDALTAEVHAPPPTIERDGERLTLWFADDGHVEGRERFEELAQDHRLVEVVDGDREWLAVRIAANDPEPIVRELWDAACVSS